MTITLTCGLSKEQSPADDTLNVFVEADLEGFVLYRQHRSRRTKKSNTLEEATLSNELIPLNEINDFNVQSFYFDGFICYEGKRTYVQKVPFNLLSIGSYEDVQTETVGTNIWIQSLRGSKLGVWYRPTIAAPEYQKYQVSN